MKLERSPSDAPQFRASNGDFTVRIEDLVAELPVAGPPRTCARTRRIRIPRVPGGRIVGVRVYVNGRRVRRLRGRALRRRTILLRDLRGDTARVRLRITVRNRDGRTRILNRKRTLRLCSASESSR